MSTNLISTGLIEVKSFSLSQLKQEAASFLGIAMQRIERIQCWQHQLWVVIQGVRAKLISYRCLPSWLNHAISVITNTRSLEELAELGDIIAEEANNHPYEAEALEKLRQVYAMQREHLRELQPAIKHQQAAQDWLDTWEKMLNYCDDTDALEYLAVQIKIQSQKFADLPEIIAQLRQIWSNRWQDLKIVLSS